MSPLKTSLIAALASAVLTVGLLYFFHHRRSEEAAGLRAANARMRWQVLERAPTERSSVVPSATVTATASAAALSPEKTVLRAGDFRNEGQATPLATLQMRGVRSDPRCGVTE